jgi:glycosyltransferase involved in cell wall biosynthesis
VARYAAEGVRYVYKENGGAGSARNRGIAETTGDLLVFLDADDRWDPEKTALQLDHFSRYPSVGLVTGSEWQVHSSDEPPEHVHREPVGAADLYSRTLVENMIGNPSLVMVRRDCFDRVGLFDEGLRLGQDWDMWIRIAREYPIGIVNRLLIRYERHGAGLTAGATTARYRSNREIQRRYIPREHGFLRRVHLLRKAQSMSFYYTAAGLLEQGTGRGAPMALALAAVLFDPVYQAKMKFGVLFRAAFGRAAFNALKRVLRRR